MRRTFFALALCALSVPLAWSPLDPGAFSMPPGLLAQYVFVGFNKGGGSAPSYSVGGICTGVNGSTTTLSCAVSPNLVSGSLVYVHAWVLDATAGKTITISTSSGCTGITWTQLDTTTVSTGLGYSAHAVGTGQSAGACTPLATYSGAANPFRIDVSEFKGSSTNTVDVHGAGAYSGFTSGSTINGQAVTTTTANDLVISDFADFNNSSTWTANTGTLAESQAAIATQYQLDSGTGSITPVANYAGASPDGTHGTVAIKP